MKHENHAPDSSPESDPLRRGLLCGTRGLGFFVPQARGRESQRFIAQSRGVWRRGIAARRGARKRRIGARLVRADAAVCGIAQLNQLFEVLSRYGHCSGLAAEHRGVGTVVAVAVFRPTRSFLQVTSFPLNPPNHPRTYSFCRSAGGWSWPDHGVCVVPPAAKSGEIPQRCFFTMWCS